MRILTILLLAGAFLIAVGCKHDLSKVADAGLSGSGGGPGPDGIDGGDPADNGGTGGESGDGPGESGTGGTEPMCMVGDVRPCNCPDGSGGMQGCEPGGNWGPCDCGGIIPTGGTGGEEAGTGGDPGRAGTGGTGGVAPAPIICESRCIGDSAVDLCTQHCNLMCDNMERFCEFSRCKLREITCAPDGEVVQECISICEDDADCARAVCEIELNSTCSEYQDYCLNNDVVCDPNGTCLDTCSTAADYDCDDGGPDSAYSSCGWGTDCYDCGTRYGVPPVCSAVGCGCTQNRDCCGFYRGRSACVNTPDGTATCFATCMEGMPADCDTGQECVGLDDGLTYVCAWVM